jgi:hypothetical protein
MTNLPVCPPALLFGDFETEASLMDFSLMSWKVCSKEVGLVLWRPVGQRF